MRNFYTTKGKKGATDKVLFMAPPSYNCRGDPYRSRTSEGGRTMVKDGFKLGGHDMEFRPAKAIHEKVHRPAAYPYIALGPKAKKSFKNAEGEVITENRNFYTTRLKTGKCGRGTSFSGTIPYIADDPDIVKKLVRKEREYH